MDDRKLQYKALTKNQLIRKLIEYEDLYGKLDFPSSHSSLSTLTSTSTLIETETMLAETTESTTSTSTTSNTITNSIQIVGTGDDKPTNSNASASAAVKRSHDEISKGNDEKSRITFTNKDDSGNDNGKDDGDNVVVDDDDDDGDDDADDDGNDTPAKELDENSLEAKLAGMSRREKKRYKRLHPTEFDYSKYNKRHIALKLSYFGWNYKGFAIQTEDVETVETHLLQAFATSKLMENFTTSNYARCGRTDSGVSAFGQVMLFFEFYSFFFFYLGRFYIYLYIFSF